MPSYYSSGLPPDLDAKLTAARLRADLDFEEAKRGQHPIIVRRLLIERRVIPEIVAFAGVACEMARRDWLPIGAVEQEVQGYQRTLARQLCPDAPTDSGWDDRFQREVRQSLESSEQWRGCRSKIADTAEALLAERSTEAPTRSLVAFDHRSADLESEAGRRAAVQGFLAWCEQALSQQLTLKDFAAAMGHSTRRQLQYWMSAKAGNKATKATDQKARHVLRMSPSTLREALKRSQ
jgi:hypothetical protein